LRALWGMQGVVRTAAVKEKERMKKSEGCLVGNNLSLALKRKRGGLRNQKKKEPQGKKKWLCMGGDPSVSFTAIVIQGGSIERMSIWWLIFKGVWAVRTVQKSRGKTMSQ